MNEAEEFRRTVLAHQAEAETALHHGDPGPRMEMWSTRNPSTLFGADGMFESGWEALSETFARVASRFSNVSDYRFAVLVADVVGDMAYAVGVERFNGSIDGGPVEPVTVRSTHIYRREQSEWKIVHRHGDNPPRDPRPRPADGGQQRHSFVATPAAGEALDSPGGFLTFLATGDHTDMALTAFESSAAPGHGPPFHLHVGQDELIYVLEGRLRVRLDDTVHDAPAGSLAFFRRGAPHAWQNVGETPSRIFVALTPAAPGMERFFERAAELPEDSRTADAFRDFADDAGMVVLGPPLAKTHPAP
jgi:quercetin dioxygenase-like cupin family protein/ketosteroid isomerase-like protein